mgnify:FL=1|jgi:hypothetical protein|tara:strand:- start:1568 stop:2122 length:555 start_codon:yes stop_codon:yes gene_type:complete
MNIFHLSIDTREAAHMHLDKHVVKMIIEYAQLMSTAHRVLDGEEYYDKTKNGRRIKRWKLQDKEMESMLYKASHVNHPSGIWTRKTHTNYLYLYAMWKELCKEYTYRYGKIHLTQSKLEGLLSKAPKNISQGARTEFAQAMPDYCKRDNAIEAYRFYYINEKKGFAKWTKRNVPYWWYEGVNYG